MSLLRRSIVVLILLLILLAGACSAAKRPLVVCFGDSLTAGFLVEHSGGYPERLSELLHIPVMNAGSTGDTSYAALARVESVIAKNPTHVLVELGANDYLLKIDPEACRKNLEKCLDAFKDRNIRAALLIFFNDAMIANSNRNDRSLLSAYRTMYEEVGKEYGIPIVRDIWGAGFSDERIKIDSYHPNAEGYRIMGEMIYRELLLNGFFD